MNQPLTCYSECPASLFSMGDRAKALRGKMTSKELFTNVLISLDWPYRKLTKSDSDLVPQLLRLLITLD